MDYLPILPQLGELVHHAGREHELEDHQKPKVHADLLRNSNVTSLIAARTPGTSAVGEHASVVSANTAKGQVEVDPIPDPTAIPGVLLRV